MKYSLYTKLLLGYLLFALLSILFINTWTTNRVMVSLIDKSSENLYNEGLVIIGKYMSNDIYSATKNAESKSYISTSASLTKSTIWVVDSNNKVLYDTSDNFSKSAVSNFNINDFNSRHYIRGYFYGNFQNETLTVSVPIRNNQQITGYLLLHKNMSFIYDDCNEQIYIVFLTFIAVFAFSLIIILLFTFIVFIPITKINAASREFAKGNFTYEGLSKFTSDDELGELGVSLNYMASKLNDIENDEKKFISNVSHDFRSPLTSIKGYVEAIKDGTIPYEMQDKYLDRVLFETDRLTKLTDNLLTLGSWDNKAGRLILIDFNLYELLQPIVDSLSGKAEKKKVNIRLQIESYDFLVNADRDKIQQVVYNLLDNAIKFSNNDSNIDVKTYEKNDKIFVSIKDSGIGIPKDSVSKIWDRFYKTDLSRGKDKTGTGLGLSIVKEIIAGHNENINCISTEGVGTEFVFTLQKSKK